MLIALGYARGLVPHAEALRIGRMLSPRAGGGAEIARGAPAVRDVFGRRARPALDRRAPRPVEHAARRASSPSPSSSPRSTCRRARRRFGPTIVPPIRCGSCSWRRRGRAAAAAAVACCRKRRRQRRAAKATAESAVRFLSGASRSRFSLSRRLLNRSRRQCSRPSRCRRWSRRSSRRRPITRDPRRRAATDDGRERQPRTRAQAAASAPGPGPDSVKATAAASVRDRAAAPAAGRIVQAAASSRRSCCGK